MFNLDQCERSRNSRRCDGPKTVGPGSSRTTVQSKRSAPAFIGDSPMDSNFAWIIILIGVGAIVFYFAKVRGEAKTQAKQDTLSTELATVVDHLSDLWQSDILIKLFAGEPPDIALQGGERILCVFPNTTLLEPRSVRTWQSAYGGPTIRIAKGLSFRAGASHGVSESHDELRTIDEGTFLLTNKRLVFLGAHRTKSVSLEKVVDIKGYKDGLTVHRESKEKNEIYEFSRSLNGSSREGVVARFRAGPVP
jgi:hypothetical protein